MRIRLIFVTALISIWSIQSTFAQSNKPIANASGIQFFEGTWDEALALSKKEGKPIFLDVYATWCGPCKMLKRNTFSNAEAGKYFNKHFINVALDGEKGDGIKMARKLNVQAYPSLYILDSNGNKLMTKTGYIQAKELIKFGKQAMARGTKLAVLN